MRSSPWPYHVDPIGSKGRSQVRAAVGFKVPFRGSSTMFTACRKTKPTHLREYFNFLRLKGTWRCPAEETWPPGPVGDLPAPQADPPVLASYINNPLDLCWCCLNKHLKHFPEVFWGHSKRWLCLGKRSTKRMKYDSAESCRCCAGTVIK